LKCKKVYNAPNPISKTIILAKKWLKHRNALDELPIV
jgi:hypothetical protein